MRRRHRNHRARRSCSASARHRGGPAGVARRLRSGMFRSGRTRRRRGDLGGSAAARHGLPRRPRRRGPRRAAVERHEIRSGSSRSRRRGRWLGRVGRGRRGGPARRDHRREDPLARRPRTRQRRPHRGAVPAARLADVDDAYRPRPRPARHRSQRRERHRLLRRVHGHLSPGSARTGPAPAESDPSAGRRAGRERR